MKSNKCPYRALFVVNCERSVEDIQVGDNILFSFNVLGSVQWITQEIAVAANAAVSQLDWNRNSFCQSTLPKAMDRRVKYYLDGEGVIIDALNGDGALQFNYSILLLQFVDTGHRATDVVVHVLSTWLPSY